MSGQYKKYTFRIFWADDVTFRKMLRSQGWSSPYEYFEFKVAQDVAIYKHKEDWLLPHNDFTRRPAGISDHAINHLNAAGDLDAKRGLFVPINDKKFDEVELNTELQSKICELTGLKDFKILKPRR